MIEGYLGRLGAGKTYAMVKDSLPYIGKLAIYANMEGLDWATYFDTWDDLCGLTNALVLIDELGLWAMARDYKTFPREVLQHVINSRKQGLHIKWTAQNEGGIDVTFRRQTASYYRHERYGPFIKQTTEDAGSGQKMFTRWFRLSETVYKRYDTFQIVGNGHGQSTQRGAAAARKERERAEELVKGAWVRLEPDPAVLHPLAFRRAVPEDIGLGLPIWKAGPDGIIKRVDTSELDHWRIVQRLHEITGLADQEETDNSIDATSPELDRYHELAPTAHVSRPWFAKKGGETSA